MISKKTILIAGVGILLSSCSMVPEKVSDAQRLDVYNKRGEAFYAGEHDFYAEPLRFTEALALGMVFNLDQRLAMLEKQQAKGDIRIQKLSMLPTLEAKASYLGRDSDRATSSLSALTRTESLEPSYSTDEHRRTMSLDLAYNTLDIGLGYWNSKQAEGQAGIAVQRQRKVSHDIVRDIRSAYWRVAALQELKKEKQALFNKADDALLILDKTQQMGLKLPTQTLAQQKRIQDLVQQVQDLEENLSNAKIELAGLIGFKPDQPFKVDASLDDFVAGTNNLKNMDASKEDLTAIALTTRPEIIEQLHQIGISKTELKKIVVNAFPVVGGLLSGEYDSNSFQAEPSLATFSVDLSFELIKFITGPARYKQGEKELAFEEERLKALTAAIMTQVYAASLKQEIEKEQLALARRNYEFNDRLVTEVKREVEAELSADIDLVEGDLQRLIAKIRLGLAYVDLQSAQGQLINALGIDLFPENPEQYNFAELEAILKKRMDQLNKENLESLATLVKDQ